jgi:NTP pyrophosphatase (non-canonical NTP hydrolase)
MSFDVDVGEIADAVRKGDADWIWSAIVSAYEERDAARAPLSFGQLRAANVQRCETSFHPIEDWSLTDWLTALAGEVGEVAGVIKKHRRRREIVMQSVDVDGLPIPPSRLGDTRGPVGVGVVPVEYGCLPPLTDEERQELALELADVQAYLDLLARRAGIDLGAATREKFNIVSDRVGSDVKL